MLKKKLSEHDVIKCIFKIIKTMPKNNSPADNNILSRYLYSEPPVSSTVHFIGIRIFNYIKYKNVIYLNCII